MLDRIAEDLEKIREIKPLVHHLTNYVVMNETANATLAIGALPVMAHAQDEVEEMVNLAGALVLNIGTLEPYWIESMILAGKKANKLGVPVVLDPVGAGATRLRTEAAKRILNEIKVSVVRGNAGEISVLSGFGGKVKGVESEEAGGEVKEVAKKLSSKYGLVTAITGKVDVVTDGNRGYQVENGHEMLSRITGTGCMATTLIGSFLGVEKDYLLAAVGGLVAFGIAGEKAAKGNEGKPGSFQVALFDALANLSFDDIKKMGRVLKF